MSTRRKARQAAIGMLYADNIGNEKVLDYANEILDDLKLKGDKRDFALALFNGAKEHRAKSDELISQKLSVGWTLERLGMVERAILRLATYELTNTATDKPVVINEAIELTKELADDQAPKLINGILESIRKDLV